MNVKDYIKNLRSSIPAFPTPDERASIEPMLSYARAYEKGAEALKAYRDRLIAREINAVHDKDAQFAILFNKDTKPEEHEAYQAFRISCKAKVDELMAKLKAELEEELLRTDTKSATESLFEEDDDDEI